MIIATGLKDTLPSIQGIHQYYGKSLFSCPFCDGWEMRNRPLVIISENEHAFHMTKMLWNWSKDLVLCTNGKKVVSEEQKEMLRKNHINVIEEEISSLHGTNGHLEKIIFNNGMEIRREGGIIATSLTQSFSLIKTLGIKLNQQGGIETDNLGRTNIEGLYACGDNTLEKPPQVVIAAAEGSKTASSVIADLINEEF